MKKSELVAKAIDALNPPTCVRKHLTKLMMRRSVESINKSIIVWTKTGGK